LPPGLKTAWWGLPKLACLLTIEYGVRKILLRQEGRSGEPEHEAERENGEKKNARSFVDAHGNRPPPRRFEPWRQ
jgi:hypothetical protein